MIVNHTPPSPTQSEEARRKSQNFYTPTREQLLLLNDKKLEEAAEILNISISKLVYLRRSYGIRKYTKKEELEGSSHFQIKGNEVTSPTQSPNSQSTAVASPAGLNDPKKPNPLRKTKSGNDISMNLNNGIPSSPTTPMSPIHATPTPNPMLSSSSSSNLLTSSGTTFLTNGLHPAMVNRSNSNTSLLKPEFPSAFNNFNNGNNNPQKNVDFQNFLMQLQTQQQQPSNIPPLIPTAQKNFAMQQAQFPTQSTTNLNYPQQFLQQQHGQQFVPQQQFALNPQQQQQLMYQQKIQQQQMLHQQQQQAFPQVQPQPQGFVPPKLVKLPSLSEMTDPNNFVYKQSADFFSQKDFNS